MIYNIYICIVEGGAKEEKGGHSPANQPNHLCLCLGRERISTFLQTKTKTSTNLLESLWGRRMCYVFAIQLSINLESWDFNEPSQGAKVANPAIVKGLR